MRKELEQKLVERWPTWFNVNGDIRETLMPLGGRIKPQAWRTFSPPRRVSHASLQAFVECSSACLLARERSGDLPWHGLRLRLRGRGRQCCAALRLYRVCSGAWWSPLLCCHSSRVQQRRTPRQAADRARGSSLHRISFFSFDGCEIQGFPCGSTSGTVT